MWKSSKIEDKSKTGINNAGQEMMKEDKIKNLVRESIQNSLDAIEDKSSPLEFEIEKIRIKTTNIPALNELIERFEEMKKSWPNDAKIISFCNNALEQLRASYISGLRISDYNTTGLLGINDPNGAFNSLVKGTGYSVKSSSNSGGSFGIGKSVFWANSSLRTVFINSKNINGEQGFIGRSELATIEKNLDVYSHIMYYGTENFGHLDTIPNSLANLVAREKKSGTDVLVIGLVNYDIKDKFEHEIIKSVLSEFHIAIKNGLLNFKVIGEETIEVKQNNLTEIINFLEKTISDKKYFTETLEISNVYSTAFRHEYDYKGKEFNIYMAPSESGLKVIKGIRNTGMMIHKFINRGIYSDIVSIVEIKDDYLSTLFKEMENPEHNKWDPSLIETAARRKEAKDAMKYISSCIKDTLSIVCPVDDTKRFTISSLNELLQSNSDGNMTTTKRSATITKAPEKKIMSEKNELSAENTEGNDFLDIEHTNTTLKSKVNDTTNNRSVIREENGRVFTYDKIPVSANVKILSSEKSEYKIWVSNLPKGSYYMELFLETEVSNKSEKLDGFSTSLVKEDNGVTFTTMKDINSYLYIGTITLKTSVKKSIGGSIHETFEEPKL